MLDRLPVPADSLNDLPTKDLRGLSEQLPRHRLPPGRKRSRRVLTLCDYGGIQSVRTESVRGPVRAPGGSRTRPEPSHKSGWAYACLMTPRGGSEIVGDDLGRPPGQLCSVVRPDALSPVAEAACLVSEQVEEGVAVARVVGRDALGEHAVVELEARLRYRDKHHVVAA